MSQTVVYAVGVFDLFHRGHVEFLRRAKSLGDRLVVALNGDDLTAHYKRRPITPEDDRLEIIRACRFVDHAFIINTYDNRQSIIEHKVNKIVHGDDWRGDEYLQQLRVTREFIAERQIETIYLSYWRGVSTSKMLEDISRLQSNRTPKPPIP
jgi:glycerol-3-phosphate cytidylyltransferase